MPRLLFRKGGANTWRRPTLTRPIVSLPSALRRFTSGFGMGPGGSTALWSPEVNPVADSLVCGSGLGLWGSELCLCFCQLQALPFQASPLADIHTEKSSFNSDGRLFLRPFTVIFVSNSKNRNQAERMISTGKLHILLHFHFQPINVVVYDDPSGKTHLGRSLALRCFQRLSLPNLATRPCR